MSQFKDNPNAPKVTFIRVRGRIIPIVGGKKSHKAERVLKQNIDEMTMEVEVAEAGRRTVNDDGERVTWRSTFPKHFQEGGFKTKNQWLKAVEKKSGKDYNVISEMAADRTNFKVATNQVFDNKFVSFRTIGGKVRPIRAKDENQYEFYNWKPTKEEAPF
jgi:hypothetical protein